MKFITVTHRKTSELVTINLRHVNIIKPTDYGGTHIGINNYGATGFDVNESYADVIDMITPMQEGRHRS